MAMRKGEREGLLLSSVLVSVQLAVLLFPVHPDRSLLSWDVVVLCCRIEGSAAVMENQVKFADLPHDVLQLVARFAGAKAALFLTHVSRGLREVLDGEDEIFWRQMMLHPRMVAVYDQRPSLKGSFSWKQLAVDRRCRIACSFLTFDAEVWSNVGMLSPYADVVSQFSVEKVTSWLDELVGKDKIIAIPLVSGNTLKTPTKEDAPFLCMALCLAISGAAAQLDREKCTRFINLDSCGGMLTILIGADGGLQSAIKQVVLGGTLTGCDCVDQLSCFVG